MICISGLAGLRPLSFKGQRKVNIVSEWVSGGGCKSRKTLFRGMLFTNCEARSEKQAETNEIEPKTTIKSRVLNIVRTKSDRQKNRVTNNAILREVSEYSASF